MSYDSYGFKISRIGMPEEPGATGAKIGEALRYFVDNYWPSIKDWIDAKDARSEFTQSTCKELWKQNIPELHSGYVVTDDDYTTSEAVESWKIEYYGEFPFAQWSYTVLAFPYDRETSFTRYGDGGYLNWAFYGYCTRENNIVYFHETEYSKQKKREEERKRIEEEEMERRKKLKERVEEQMREREEDERKRKEKEDEEKFEEEMKKNRNHGGIGPPPPF